MIAGISYYQLLWYFVIYSFFGWILEVMYHGVTLGKVVNRGFLNGPVCPVYGFGMAAVLIVMKMLAPLGQNISVGGANDGFVSLLVLFVGGVILATAVELVAGWALDVLFHTRWWDYSEFPLNFKGYICLKFSLLWGLGAVIAVRVAHPLIEAKTVSAIPSKYGWPILGVLYLIYAVDLVITVAVLVGINKKLKELDTIRSSMRKVSDELSDVVGGGSITAAQGIQESKVQAALAKAELRDMVEEQSKKAQEIKDKAMVELEERKDAIVSKADAAAEWTAAKRDAATEWTAAKRDAATEWTASKRDAATEWTASKRDAAAEWTASKRDAATEWTASKADAATEWTASKRDAAVEWTAAKRDAAAQRADALKAMLLKEHSVSRRLMKAFPDAKHHDYEELVNELKDNVNHRSA